MHPPIVNEVAIATIFESGIRTRGRDTFLVPMLWVTAIKLRNLYIWSKTALAVLKQNS